MTKQIKHIFIIVAVTVWAGSVAVGGDAPGEEDIAMAISMSLPVYWSIEDVNIQATVNDGDAIDPKIRQRFVAKAVPHEKLYSEPSQNSDWNPYIMLIETRTPQQPHRLYGVASATLVRGKWNLDLRMENSTDGLGKPIAMYSSPAIVIGSEDAQRAIGNLDAVRTLDRTLAEQAIRIEADAAILQAAADEELELLRKENRRRLQAIADRYEQERAAIEASQETLVAIAEAEAEIASLDILMGVTEKLSRKRELVREQQKKMLDKEIEDASSQRDALLAAIRSEDAGERRTGFDVMFASSEEQLSKMALKGAFDSGDENLRIHAIEVAMNSGVKLFQEMALKAWIAGLPTIILTVYDHGGNKFQGTLIFEVLAVAKDQRFTGKMHPQDVKWFQEGGFSVSKRIDGTGLVNQNRISLQGVFFKKDEAETERYCKGELGPSENAFLAGKIDCNYIYPKDWSMFVVVVDS